MLSFHIFGPLLPLSWKAGCFDSLQFSGEFRQKVNKLHMWNQTKYCLPFNLWRKRFFLQIWSGRTIILIIRISCKNQTVWQFSKMFQVGWAAQPVWKETTCIARQSEEDDTLKLEVDRTKTNKDKDNLYGPTVYSIFKPLEIETNLKCCII